MQKLKTIKNDSTYLRKISKILTYQKITIKNT